MELEAFVKSTHCGRPESNSNYNLLAFIIEQVSRQSYGEFLKEHIFDPLNLRNTRHDGDANSLIPNKASGYLPVGVDGLENAPYLDWSTKTGNGSIYSTVEDLYRWDRALYTERILKKASLDRMFHEQYGWFAGQRLRRNIVRMNGRSPGFSTEILRFVDDDVCIIVLSNDYAPTASIMATDLARIVFRESYEVPKVGTGVEVDVATLKSYVGRYRFGPDFFRPAAVYEFVIDNGRLAVHTPTGNTQLVAQSNTEFFHRPLWARIVFERDKDGRVDHLLWRFGGQDYIANRLR